MKTHSLNPIRLRGLDRRASGDNHAGEVASSATLPFAHIAEHADNDLILSEMFADEVQQARRRQLGPSAEDLAILPVERIVVK